MIICCYSFRGFIDRAFAMFSGKKKEAETGPRDSFKQENIEKNGSGQHDPM